MLVLRLDRWDFYHTLNRHNGLCFFGGSGFAKTGNIHKFVKR